MLYHRVFKLSDCPTCSMAGAVLVLRRRGHHQFVFHFPSCGCAWEEPPDPTRLDSIESLETIAPEGVELPEETEVAGKFGDADLLPADEWFSYLDV